MTAIKTPVFERQAAIFGVCEALGEDFGISANWFRLALAPLMIVSPLWTLAGYFLVGMLVMATRLLWPDAVEPVAPIEALPTAANHSTPDEVRLAA